ncbi:hypothetical protein [Halalkalibacter lacteus]|uniref:hypothetical protein n=1 Tax=Halalkalibacter lacteus TaxID=3090663 RepID=UPI002FC8B681
MQKPLLKINRENHKKVAAGSESKTEIKKINLQQEKVIDPWAIILFGHPKK